MPKKNSYIFMEKLVEKIRYQLIIMGFPVQNFFNNENQKNEMDGGDPMCTIILNLAFFGRIQLKQPRFIEKITILGKRIWSPAKVAKFSSQIS